MNCPTCGSDNPLLVRIETTYDGKYNPKTGYTTVDLDTKDVDRSITCLECQEEFPTSCLYEQLDNEPKPSEDIEDMVATHVAATREKLSGLF